MHRLCTLLFSAFACLSVSAQEIRSTEVATKWEQGFPVADSRVGLMVQTNATSDRLLLFSAANSGEAPSAAENTPAATILAAATKAGLGNRFSWLTPSPSEELAEIRLDWLDSEQPAKDFVRTLNPADGVVTTKFTRGSAGLTEQIFVSDTDGLIVIHLRADKPGALSFRIRLDRPSSYSATILTVQDRRVISLRGKTSSATDSPVLEVRAWLFPMESEVTPTDKDVSILGEGEALVLIATAMGPENSPALTGIGSRLKKYGFGSEEHPDISELWDGLLERHLKAHRAAMAQKP